MSCRFPAQPRTTVGPPSNYGRFVSTFARPYAPTEPSQIRVAHNVVILVRQPDNQYIHRGLQGVKLDGEC